jgi:hypothetical protein
MMGLRISKAPKGPFWLDLDFGIRLRVRYLQSPMLAALRAKAARLSKAMEDPMEAERLLGLMASETLSEEEIRTGLFHHFMTVLLAQCAIVEWEGVFEAVDADGVPLPADAPDILKPVNDANIAEVMLVPLVAEQFYARYTVRQSEIAAEGNGSGPLSSGISGAAHPIAAAASPAAAPTAPTGPMPPAPAKARLH